MKCEICEKSVTSFEVFETSRASLPWALPVWHMQMRSEMCCTCLCDFQISIFFPLVLILVFNQKCGSTKIGVPKTPVATAFCPGGSQRLCRVVGRRLLCHRAALRGGGRGMLPEGPLCSREANGRGEESLIKRLKTVQKMWKD